MKAQAVLVSYFKSNRLDKSYSPKTQKEYSYWLSRFEEFVKKPIEKVTHEDIIAWKEYLENQGMSQRTIHLALIVVKAMYSHLMMNGIISKHPLPQKLSGSQRKPITYLSFTEVANLLLSNEGHLMRESTCLVLYNCGLRLIELTNRDRLKWDTMLSLLSIRGKGNIERTIPLGEVPLPTSSIVADLFNVIFKRKRWPWDMSTRNIQLLLSKAGRKARIEKPVTQQILRHTFATHSYALGIDLARVQNRLGHSDPETTTSHYMSVPTKTLLEDYERAKPLFKKLAPIEIQRF